MVAFGEDITIEIDSTDYSKDIDSHSETGGERTQKRIKCLGNNYKVVETGRSDYEVTFNFKIEATSASDLFDDETPVTIVITVGTEQTITYYNMRPISIIPNIEVDGLATTMLKYAATAYDNDNSRYNKQIV